MVLTYFTLLMPAFSLVLAAHLLSVMLVSPTQRSPTADSCLSTRGFGGVLEPRYIFRAKAFDQ
jgi:hypothetical protein